MIDAKNRGAIADGTLHPLSERYKTLAKAQQDYPFAQSLAESIDRCVLQKAINDAIDEYGIGQGVYAAPGDYFLDEQLTMDTVLGLSLIGSGQQTRLIHGGPPDSTALWMTCCQQCSLINLSIHGMGQEELTGIRLTNGAGSSLGIVSTGDLFNKVRLDNLSIGVTVMPDQADVNNDSHVFRECSFQCTKAGVVVSGGQSHFLRFHQCGFQAPGNSGTYGIWCQYGSYVHAVECAFNGMEIGMRLDDFFTGPCSAVRCNGENLRRLMTTNWHLNRGGQYNTIVEGCRMAFGPADVSDYVLDFKHDGPFRITDNNFYSTNDKPPLIALRGITMRGIHENNVWTRQTGDWTTGALTYLDGAMPADYVRDFANTYNSPSGSIILP